MGINTATGRIYFQFFFGIYIILVMSSIWGDDLVDDFFKLKCVIVHLRGYSVLYSEVCKLFIYYKIHFTAVRKQEKIFFR